MKVLDKNYRTIWYDGECEEVKIIDQRTIPFQFEIETIRTHKQMATAIKDMHLRGAGLIGAAAAWGIYLAVKENPQWTSIVLASELLISTRPTAVNLQYAVTRMMYVIMPLSEGERLIHALKEAQSIADEDANACRDIGFNGFELIKKIPKKSKRKQFNILTHCNAGWLAFVDYGSALSPVYEAFNQGFDIHVYVDETRPRNQGARLTAWELGMQGVPHTLIADNVGGYLMQQGLIDMVIVGADRVSKNGDVANKIGTYLKALAAKDNNVPFFVGFPSSTYDNNIIHGEDIPIEERGMDEVLFMTGWNGISEIEIRIAPEFTKAVNFGFDITPARLVSAYITEKGVFKSDELFQNLT